MWPFEYEKISRDLKVCCTSYVQIFYLVLQDVRVNLITLNFLRGRLWEEHSIFSSEGAQSSLTVSKTLFLAKNSLTTDNYCLCDVCATYFVRATYLSILYDLLWCYLSNYKGIKVKSYWYFLQWGRYFYRMQSPPLVLLQLLVSVKMRSFPFKAWV